MSNPVLFVQRTEIHIFFGRTEIRFSCQQLPTTKTPLRLLTKIALATTNNNPKNLGLGLPPTNIDRSNSEWRHNQYLLVAATGIAALSK